MTTASCCIQCLGHSKGSLFQYQRPQNRTEFYITSPFTAIVVAPSPPFIHFTEKKSAKKRLKRETKVAKKFENTKSPTKDSTILQGQFLDGDTTAHAET